MNLEEGKKDEKIIIDDLRTLSDWEKRAILGRTCLYSRKVSMRMSKGFSLDALQQACAYDCGHHHCIYEQLSHYLERNHFRPKNYRHPFIPSWP